MSCNARSRTLLVLTIAALAACTEPTGLDQVAACEGTCDNCVPIGGGASDVDGRRYTCARPEAASCWSAGAQAAGGTQWDCVGDGCLSSPGNCEGHQDLLTRLRAVVDSLGDQACDALRPIVADPAVRSATRAVSRPALIVGGSSSFGTLDSTLVGVDLVFDLWSHEAAVFHYAGNNLTLRALGADLGAYTGYAVGMHQGLASWTGEFAAASGAVSVPLPLNASVTAGLFTAIDAAGAPVPGGVVGGFVGGSIGLDLIKLPVNGQLSRASWTMSPSASAIVAEATRWMLGGYDPATGVIRFPTEEPYIDVVDLAGLGGFGPHARASMRMAAALLALMPLNPFADIAAVHAVALGVVRDAGYDDLAGYYQAACGPL